MDKPICGVSDCETKVLAKGYCVKHYARWNKYGDPLYVTPRPQKKPCSIEDCGRTAIAKTFCTLHYTRFKKHGDPLYAAPIANRKPCRVDECDRKADAHGYCSKHLRRLQRTGDPRGTRRKFKPKPKCIIDSCDNEGNNVGFGWCQKHYRRYKRHGSPFVTSRIVGNDIARFWSYVMPGEKDECWEWQGGTSPDGYGILAMNKTTTYMPRFAYELLREPIPEGLEPDHLCRNRICVNPWHLEPVTHKENILRGESPTAINARKTHCIRGHEFDEENTRIDSRGGRRCKTCEKMHSANRHRRKARSA